jgi:UPF0755 protein
MDAAIDSLEAHGIVRHPALFHFYARVRGLGRSLKSGNYSIRPDASWGDVVATLKRGRGVETRWTVPEGLTIKEIADLASSDLGVSRDAFVLATQDSALRRELGLQPNTPNVEGYLFPTTYTLPARVTARELARVMTHEFATQWQPEWQARLDTLGMTRHQLVTLASIIEAEVRYDPDRVYVSAVYHNRLKRGWRLDADPTVSYAYGRRLKRVWEKNLAIESPYNTYRHTGLPPGPIGQPGRSSIMAALYPAPVPFLFFVAQPDGKHIFSTTLAQHNAAIQVIKRSRPGSR